MTNRHQSNGNGNGNGTVAVPTGTGAAAEALRLVAAYRAADVAVRQAEDYSRESGAAERLAFRKTGDLVAARSASMVYADRFDAMCGARDAAGDDVVAFVLAQHGKDLTDLDPETEEEIGMSYAVVVGGMLLVVGEHTNAQSVLLSITPVEHVINLD